ncbi:hypothetical protein BB560_003483 [Smittium megazygosporum]|uniref:Tf2-1-like SH3-like domain-containing protein n=1 Tax=Smittium megazygosporum TaxID=133381 RepID=A0A2T9ZBV3_9FUNG|nr:hypothetical protein BB560_003483 [Smittium megazygosporum]
MRQRYNARHRATEYQIGDYVLLKRQTADGLNSTLGLSSAYTGPYRIVDKIGRVSYLLEYMDDYGYRTRTTAHINRLKPYYSRTVETQAMGEEDDVTLTHEMRRCSSSTRCIHPDHSRRFRKTYYSTTRMPNKESNGMAKIFNRTLKAMTKTDTTDIQSKCDQHLDMHVFAYRTAKH